MKKRIVALLLILILCTSFLHTTARAADVQYTITVDLTEYTGNVLSATLEDDYGFTNEDYIASAVPGQSKTITYTYDREQAMNNAYIEFILKLDAPVQSWVIDGVTYTENYESDDPVTADWGYDSWDVSNDNGQASCYKWLTDGQTSYTIKAVSAAAAEDYTLEIKSSDSSEGSVTKTLIGNNQYKLTAQPNDGYLFDYWQKTVPAGSEEKFTENPHTVTLTENETWTAYFRKAYQATVKLADGCEGMGVVKARYESGDNWYITATANKGYGFTGWSTGTDSTSDSFNVTLKEDTTFTANFVRSQVMKVTDIRLYVCGQSENPDDSAVETTDDSTDVQTESVIALFSNTRSSGVPLKKGTDITAQIQFALNHAPRMKTYPHGQILIYEGEVTAENEATAKLLAKRSGDIAVNVAGNDVQSYVQLNDLPLLESGKLTAVLYTDSAEPYQKVYQTIDVSVEDTVQTLDLNYLTTPDKATPTDGNIAALDRGPTIFGGAAYLDETGNVSLFLAGNGGVYQLGYNQEYDLTIMPGQSDIYNPGDNDAMRSSALAVGGPAANQLTAFIRKGGESISYELRTWNGQTWTPVDGSEKTSGFDMMDGKRVVVISDTDVWAGGYHWNGVEWADSGMALTSALRLDAEHVYATTKDGLYRYADGKWTQINISAAGHVLLGGNRSGQLVLSDKNITGNYPFSLKLVSGADTATAAIENLPAVTQNILGSTWTLNGPEDNREVNQSAVIRMRGAGITADGKIYVMIARAYGNYLGGSYVFVLEDGSWKLTDCDEFHDPRDALAKKYRPNGINAIWDLADNVTVFTGLTGSVYLAKAQQTVTFDAMGGTCEMETYTGDVWSTVKLPTPVKSGAQFQGWYLDKAYTKLWTPPVVPAKPITVYAKWSDSDTGDKYAEDREKALKQLELALGRMDKDDYTETNWQRVLTEYENGRYAISIAAPNPTGDSVSEINKAVQDTIYAALNDAISRMNAIPMKRIKDANIVVSLDAQTLGLGYLIKPTCVKVTEATQASKVITDLIKQAVNARFAGEGEVLEGHQEYHAGEPAEKYAYIHTGTIEDSFYLAEVYWPEQGEATVASYITDKTGPITSYAKDRAGNYLGEFDYYSMSGWMYSVAETGKNEDGTFSEVSAPSFPGVGAAQWRMRDGEVMRWQFTVYGYGADLNADNSAWGQDSITGNSGDKTELTYEIAMMREAYKNSSTEKTYEAGDDKLETSRIYMNVFDGVLCNPLATQEQLDAAVADLDLVATELENASTLRAVSKVILQMGTVKVVDGELVKDGEVTAESGEKIAAARKAYEELGDLKSIFDKAYPEYIKALTDAEEAYNRLLATESDKAAAAAVNDMIDALPNPDDVTLDDKDAINAALEAYDKLSDAAKDYVDAEKRDKLTACKDALDAAKVDAMIDALPDPDKITLRDKAAIDAAMKAYDDLSEAAKGYVENHNKLVACKEAYDKLNDKPNPPTPPTPPPPSKPTTPSKPKDDKPTTGASFTDVPSGSWYADAVNYVSEKGLMNGTSKNSFSPNATTTRGMIVTILARVEGVNTNGTPWYAAGQKWAMDNGISDGTNMTGEVTREQLAAILYRYAKLKGYDTSKSNKLDSFKDADKVSSWAVEAMQWANAEGLINGKSNSMLDPQGKATRAETAAILMRFMENIAK